MQKLKSTLLDILGTMLPIAMGGFCVAFVGCGESATHGSAKGRPRSSQTADLMGDEDDDDHAGTFTTGGRYDNDVDGDDDRGRQLGYRDADDMGLLSYGRAANAADARIVAAVVKRYYAHAAADDGAEACSLMSSRIAASVIETLGRSPGPEYLRGNTCAKVMSLLFEHERKLVTGAVRVTGVRVNGADAIAFIGSARIPASYLSLERSDHSWRIVEPLSVALP